MSPPSATTRLRACREVDIPAIRDILEYYVLNTVLTLALTPPSHQDVHGNWSKSVNQGLPYIVAVDEEEDKVLGFCSANEFRGAGGKAGYRHTVELTLYCHPDHMKKGLGSALLDKLVEILKSPELCPDFVDQLRLVDSRVRVLLACMSVDENTWNEGLGLRDFYVKHGFTEVGHMKHVGHKFDRW